MKKGRTVTWRRCPSLGRREPALGLVHRRAHEKGPARDRDHVDADIGRQRFGEQGGGGFFGWQRRPPSHRLSHS